MLITLTILLKLLSIIPYGMALGIGFWLSKKVTNKIDEKLLLNNKDLILEYSNGI